MLSDEQWKKVSRHLMRRVALDKNAMTFRLLSRETAISTRDAKQALERWYNEPGIKDRNVSLVWCFVSSSERSTLRRDDGDDEEMNDPSTLVRQRVYKLVLEGDQDETPSDFESKFAYGIVPTTGNSSSTGGSALLSMLTNCSLSNVPDADKAKWPARPADLPEWSIRHPQGDRTKKSSTSRGKPAAAAKPERVASVPKKEASTSKKSAFDSSSKAKSAVKKEKPSTKPTSRPMGALGGLFADRNKSKASSSSSSSSTIPSKRPKKEEQQQDVKPSVKKPKKTVKNGLFQDEVSDDDDDDDDDDDVDVMQVDDVKPAKSKSVSRTSSQSKVVKDETDHLLELFDDDDGADMDAIMAQAENNKRGPGTKAAASNANKTNKSASPSTSQATTGNKKTGNTLTSFFKK